jgi:hypothetical protein
MLPKGKDKEWFTAFENQNAFALEYDGDLYIGFDMAPKFEAFAEQDGEDLARVYSLKEAEAVVKKHGNAGDWKKIQSQLKKLVGNAKAEVVAQLASKGHHDLV